MNKVRWGLLSTANINRQLIPAIRGSRRGELVAVASRSLEYAQAYADHWDIPKAFGDYDSMLTSGLVDAVYISLPNHLHAEWSIRAMQSGVHVLCEKPLAISIDEVDAMMRASQQYSIRLAEAFMYRHHPQTKIIAEWVRSGRLGEVCSLYTAFTFILGNRQNIRFLPEYGGGSLWDLGVYPVSFAQYIMGEIPDWVVGAQWLGDTGVDETFSGLMHYSANRFAQFTCGFRSPWQSYAEITGTQGRLSITRPFVGMDKGRQLIFYSDGNDPVEVPVPEQELYLGEVEDMNNAILDGGANYLSLAESLNHIRTTLALVQSASLQRVEPL